MYRYIYIYKERERGYHVICYIMSYDIRSCYITVYTKHHIIHYNIISTSIDAQKENKEKPAREGSKTNIVGICISLYIYI